MRLKLLILMSCLVQSRPFRGYDDVGFFQENDLHYARTVFYKLLLTSNPNKQIWELGLKKRIQKANKELSVLFFLQVE